MLSPRHRSRRTLQSYLVGWVLAVMLTSAAFGLIAVRVLELRITLMVIGLLAVVQCGVHLRYFLDLRVDAASRDNNLALIFTAVLLLLMIGGTVWIMSDLHQRMMP